MVRCVVFHYVYGQNSSFSIRTYDIAINKVLRYGTSRRDW